MNCELIVKPVQLWVEHIIVGLHLCPFAKRELMKNRIRFAPTDAATEEQLLEALLAELELLNSDTSIETTLLIHPYVLENFDDYNQFLSDADNLLQQRELVGIYQIASFHPEYQFDGTQANDVENYTNRSPYPLLHLLRESSLDRAISDHPDTGQIPENNIRLLKNMGQDKIRALFIACFDGIRK